MMQTTFAVTALLSIALGRKLSAEEQGDFIRYVTDNNKHYETIDEMYERNEIYLQNLKVIEELNELSAASGKANAATFGVNHLTDLTPEEFAKMYTGGHAEVPESERQSLYNEDRGGVRGVVDAITVDHAADGFMTPVKSQGNCLGCWAFAAASTLEGTIAKKLNKKPVRLSEQNIIDCELGNNNQIAQNNGCAGGLEYHGWDFWKVHGVMKHVDYPFTSKDDGQTKTCKHDSTKTIGKVKGWDRVHSLTEMKKRIKQQPLSIGLSAASIVFQNYKSGVITSNMPCSTHMDHSVVIVGYTEAAGPTEEVCDCKTTKWWNRCECYTVGDEADDNGYSNYWKIQNSWGTWWGDDGFVLIEMTEGKGVCGMNQDVTYVEW